MAQIPQVFVMPDIPKDQLQSVIDGINEEGLFNIIEIVEPIPNPNAIVSLKVKRKAPPPGQ